MTVKEKTSRASIRTFLEQNWIVSPIIMRKANKNAQLIKQNNVEDCAIRALKFKVRHANLIVW